MHSVAPHPSAPDLSHRRGPAPAPPAALDDGAQDVFAAGRAARAGERAWVWGAAAFTALWGAAKLTYLHRWLYAEDIFMVRSMAQETLRGHLGLEFMYGNQFGDHLYLWLLPLLPLEWLLRDGLLTPLALLTPLVFFAHVWLIVRMARGSAYATRRGWLLAGALPAVLLPAAALERLHGFHFDSAATYLGSALAVCELLRQRRDSAALRRVSWLLWAAFVGAQEVFALLAAIFYGVCWIGRRQRAAAAKAVASAAYLGVAMAVIRLCQTPYNRTDGALLRAAWAGLVASPLGYLGQATGRYWAVAALGTLAFAAAVALGERLCWTAAALFVMGAARLAMVFLGGDFSLVNWHVFPGLVWMAQATGLQAAAGGLTLRALPRPVRAALPLAGPAALVALAWANWSRLPALPTRPEVAARAAEVAGLAAEVRPTHLVSVQYGLAYPLRHRARTTAYPRGVTRSPQGIADFVLLDEAAPLSAPVPACYRPYRRTPHYVLLRREPPCGALDGRRADFEATFGPGVLGAQTSRGRRTENVAPRRG